MQLGAPADSRLLGRREVEGRRAPRPRAQGVVVDGRQPRVPDGQPGVAAAPEPLRREAGPGVELLAHHLAGGDAHARQQEEDEGEAGGGAQVRAQRTHRAPDGVAHRPPEDEKGAERPGAGDGEPEEHHQQHPQPPPPGPLPGHRQDQGRGQEVAGVVGVGERRPRQPEGVAPAEDEDGEGHQHAGPAEGGMSLAGGVAGRAQEDEEREAGEDGAHVPEEVVDRPRRQAHPEQGQEAGDEEEPEPGGGQGQQPCRRCPPPRHHVDEGEDVDEQDERVDGRQVEGQGGREQAGAEGHRRHQPLHARSADPTGPPRRPRPRPAPEAAPDPAAATPDTARTVVKSLTRQPRDAAHRPCQPSPWARLGRRLGEPRPCPTLWHAPKTPAPQSGGVGCGGSNHWAAAVPERRRRLKDGHWSSGMTIPGHGDPAR